MSLFVYPFSPVLDAGELSPGALAKFYISGTSTPADGQSGNPSVYTTATLATAHDWPVEADSDGNLPNIFLDPAYRYKVVITDADGTELFTADPVPDSRTTMRVETVTTATHTMDANDHGVTLYRTYAGAMTDTLPSASSVGNGWWVNIVNGNAASTGNAITVSVSGGGTINGSSSSTVPDVGRCTLVSTGSVYLAWTMGDAPPLTHGFHSDSVSAAYLSPTTTNGVAGTLQQGESSTNKVNYFYWPLLHTDTKNLFHHIVLPAKYLGTIAPQAAFIWTAVAGSVGDTVRWGIKARFAADDDAIDAPWGSSVNIDDALLAQGDVHVTSWTAFTPSGAGNDGMLFFQVWRDHTAGTLGQTARLLGVRFRIPYNRGNDN